MDHVSRDVIRYIKSFDDKTFHINKGYQYKKLSYDEFLLCLDYLEQEGYVSLEAAGSNPHAIVSATLTHKGRHASEIWIRDSMHAFIVSVACPIVVSAITTIITLSLQGS